MSAIGIIDYDMGNLGSVTNACRFLNLDAQVVTSPDELTACRAVILPGVGAFGDCMAHLRDHGFVSAVQTWIADGKPFLGICLGLQVLFEGSEESPGVEGLGVLPGVVRKFQAGPDWKVPQIGWNRVRQADPSCPLFQGIPDERYFYFVHSYFADAAGASFAAGVTHHGVTYASAIWEKNVMAVQFHPEKSQKLGLQMLANFGVWIDQQTEVGV